MAFETGISLYRRHVTGPGEISVTIAMTILDLQFEIWYSSCRGDPAPRTCYNKYWRRHEDGLVDRVIDVSKNEHMQDWYRKINPNGLDSVGSIPVITDTLPNGEKITLFETGTILEYLADRYDYESRINPRDCLKSDLKMMSWVCYTGHLVNSHLCWNKQ
ncbi:hypothetical protein E4U09_008311 [Claviceps aff. purpurea]|uniref:GST N-terminal domain-containing protein n=1 Tax=Claviceps aff. purpurea TaxID=1967640 RepID=A0A9P7TZC4_9HYPO|nr:hypothetical protein E4U09_008311 [Claviceps aff. purpurea]